jgi:hypothetical protein
MWRGPATARSNLATFGRPVSALLLLLGLGEWGAGWREWDGGGGDGGRREGDGGGNGDGEEMEDAAVEGWLPD